jgi:cytochrome c-type biogenesis protein CcmH
MRNLLRRTAHGVLTAAFLLPSVVVSPVGAVAPDEVLRDAALEARARAISQELRCVVCQNQSIDDSNAPLARDLRILLRERLSSGDSDEQAIRYIASRYGNFILLKPPMQWNTSLLWAGPILFVIAGALGFLGYVRRRKTHPALEASEPLTPAEQQQLEALLGERGPT